MSRLTDLIRQVAQTDPQLGRDLAGEYKRLSQRRAFGLNFERHVPEAVELYGRSIKKGDLVRRLPERGSTQSHSKELYRVVKISLRGDDRIATLASLPAASTDTTLIEHPVADLVAVARFTDPIYPGLQSTGVVERGGSKPFHTVINGENYHALEMLLYTHRERVDAIYIDPPYNSRANDWKYNNDYVEPDDLYAHSKWLAMMERRLELARQLLNPSRSVLLITIDDNEVSRLALLVEQVFREAKSIDIVTTVISAKGNVRVGRFSRVEEHIICVALGSARIAPWYRNFLDQVRNDGQTGEPIEWLGLRRREPSAVRGARPNQFFPVFVESDTGKIHSIGDPVPDGVDRDTVEVPEGCAALWPLRPDGSERLWGLTPEPLRRNLADGYVRVNGWNAEDCTGTVQYLPGGTIDAINEGTIIVTGRRRDGSVNGHRTTDGDSPAPKRVWNVPSHNAETGGTRVLSALLPGRNFPYPKSLYAVEDTLRLYLADLPNALVLDFFGGSGTTAHAVFRLNKQDGGQRQSIVITNNEVGVSEETALRSQGLRPGDAAWEIHGICEQVTKPRIASAVTGETPEGEPVAGDYRYTDEFPLAEGFAENVEFFTLTYESPRRVSHNRAFAAIAPLLWLRAGAKGPRIERVVDGYAVAKTYAILQDLDQTRAFIEEVKDSESVTVAFIVTDDDRRYQMVCNDLPASVEPVRLYESYLNNFEIIGRT